MRGGRVWIFRREFDPRDWRFGVAWYTAPDGLHVFVCCGARFHAIRTRVSEMTPEAHKLSLPAERKPPAPIQGTSINFRRRR